MNRRIIFMSTFLAYVFISMQLLSMAPTKKRPLPAEEVEVGVPPAKKPRIAVMVQLTDGEVEITQEQLDLLKKVSVEIQHLMEIEETDTIPLPGITRAAFLRLLSFPALLKLCDELNNLAEQAADPTKTFTQRFAAKKQLEQRIKREIEAMSLGEWQNEQIYDVMQTANYLAIERLLDIAIGAFARRAYAPAQLNLLANAGAYQNYRTTFQFPPALSILLAQQLKQQPIFDPDIFVRHAWSELVARHIKKRAAEGLIINSHTFDAKDFALTPDGSKIITSDKSGVRVRDIKSRTEKSRLKHIYKLSDEKNKAIYLHPDGNKLLVRGEKSIDILDINTRESVFKIQYLDADLIDNRRSGREAWSPSGNNFLLKGWHLIGILDAKTGEIKLSQKGVVISDYWSPDGSRILSGLGGHLLRFFGGSVFPIKAFVVRDQDYRSQYNIQDVNTKSTHNYWSPDGKYILFTVDKKVAIWDVEQRKRVWWLDDFPVLPTDLSWSPDGNFILILFYDPSASFKHVEIWDIRSKQRVSSFTTGPTGVLSKVIVWSSDSNRILTAEGKGKVKIHDVQTGELILEHVVHPKREPDTVFESPDQTRLICKFYKSVGIWEIIDPEFFKAMDNLSFEQAQLVAAIIAGIVPIGPLPGHLQAGFASLPEIIRTLLVPLI